MRTVLSTVLAAGLLFSQGAAAAGGCTRPADKTAFDVAGLKTALMVTAITCEASDRYNGFVVRYRADLVAQEKVLAAYFSRTYGGKAQAQHDEYITSLANAQSHSGLASGSAFCKNNMAEFDEVMKLRNGAELAGYATVKAPVQPIELVDCAIPPRGNSVSIRTASATGSGKPKLR